VSWVLPRARDPDPSQPAPAPPAAQPARPMPIAQPHARPLAARTPARPHALAAAHPLPACHHGRRLPLVLSPLLAGLFVKKNPQECMRPIRLAHISVISLPSLPLPCPSPIALHPPTLLDSLADHPSLQPQQQLSQIEKSVTHLLVATKQLLGLSQPPSLPQPCPLLTTPRDAHTMVPRHRHRERSLRRLRSSRI
jgi:hypothetical protein